MADRIQVKLNRDLHQHVKDFVNSEESQYSSYKHFYEQAARELLKKEQTDSIQNDERKIEDLKQSIKEELKEEMFE